ISLALAHAQLYDGAKDALRALDFGDLIERTHELLTRRADAAWVLFKLDGGVDHVLLDEAQDTAPEQWDILRALTGEFFIGQGAGERHRTVFAVGDEKQSIFSFQGAAPERPAPEVLSFVDAVFDAPAAAAGLKPAGSAAFPLQHVATRAPGGSVELWPLEETDETEETDPWAPVDAEPKESANKKLARRIAAALKAMVARGETLTDK